MTIYKVAELFESINGEGRKAGELAVFVRFQGCNLRCSYCDTMWANADDAPSQEMTLSELLERVENFGAGNVTLTGGEPLIQRGIGELIEALSERDYQVEIETNGSVPLEAFRSDGKAFKEFPLSFTMDYKLMGSGMEQKMCIDNFRRLTREDTVKFVVASQADIERAYMVAEKYIHSRGEEAPAIYISPVFGVVEPEDIVEFMKQKRWIQARLQLQLHKFIWPVDARGV